MLYMIVAGRLMHGRAGRPMVLRVWERDACALHAIGEHIPGLLGPLAWQPNGRHTYAAQRMDGQQRVVLFERNGLSHGHFEVRHEGEHTHHSGRQPSH